MSGGFFDYSQYHIDRIADDIEHIIENNRVERTVSDVERWQLDDNGKVRDEYRYYYDYDDETISLFKDAVRQLKLAAVYAQRVDWLLSGDDGEDTFKRRLSEEVEKVVTELRTAPTEPTTNKTLEEKQLSFNFD